MDNLVHSAPLIEDDNKTAEEIEAEEEARINGENAGAIFAGAYLVKEYVTSNKKANANVAEEPQETNPHDTSDDDEDEGHGFNLHM